MDTNYILNLTGILLLCVLCGISALADCGPSTFSISTDVSCTEIDIGAIVSPNSTTEGAKIVYPCKSLLIRTTAKMDYCPVEVCQADSTWRPANLSCGSSECYNSSSMAYKGRRICTVSGKKCQRWDSQSPWSHSYASSAMFGGENITTQSKNYCRDPNGARGAPWCYTEDVATEWEFCNIPNCAVTTISQGTCPGDYCGDPDSSLSTDNTCIQVAAPGSYTRNVGSQIRFACQGLLAGFNSTVSFCPVRRCESNFYWSKAVISCGVNECYNSSASRTYMGKRNCTASGYMCQAWNTQSPHTHSFTSSDFPEGNINAAGSMCRDPGGLQGQPWCYTNQLNPVMEFCGIPECSTLPVNSGTCTILHPHGVVYKRLAADRSGFDLQTTIPLTDSSLSCCRLCSERLPCVMITFHVGTGVCRLYSQNVLNTSSIDCINTKCYVIESLV